MGVANRTDYDLTSHTKGSGTELSYFNQATGERFTPYVIEPSFGLTRSMMAFLVDAYVEDEAPNAKGGVDKRTVLRLDPRLAPVKAAVLPLSRNEDLSPKAKDLAAELRKSWNIDFDDAGAIGRRYRRQDEIGTPFCITVDFDTLEDKAVTIRERDTMTQERVSLDQVRSPTWPSASSAPSHRAELEFRPWQDGDDFALLEIFGDPATPQAHEDRTMFRADSDAPLGRCVVARTRACCVAAPSSSTPACTRTGCGCTSKSPPSTAARASPPRWSDLLRAEVPRRASPR